MSRTPRKAIGILAGVLMVVTGSAGAALASSSPKGHDQVFLVAARVEDPTAWVLAHGAVDGAGTLTAETADFHQESSSYDETDRLVVGGGALRITVHGTFSAWPFTLDPLTCTRWGTLTGTWTVDDGEGAYAGATGGGDFRGHFLTYAAHAPGGCDEGAVKGFSVGPMTGSVALRG